MKTTITFYNGFQKRLIEQRIKIRTFLHYSFLVLRREIKIKYYLRVLKRLLFFLNNMKHNKYVRIGKKIKINLYVPGFPSPAFFTACNKVIEFNRPMPCITALISITSACRYNCPHCYQKYDKGKDVDINILINVIRNLQNKGIAFFNIEGGEPFLAFKRLTEVCQAIDQRSEILINSTGDGMTKSKLQALSKLNNLVGIMFSLHTPEEETTNQFMGNDRAWTNLQHGIQLCHESNIPVLFNTCLQRDAFYDGTFEKIMETAKSFKGAILQLIKPKPAGGWLSSTLQEYNQTDKEHLLSKVDTYNLDNKYNLYTSVYAMIREESDHLFGCTAGAVDRFYINAKGDLQPCEFLNISFGNIASDNFNEIYKKMRSVFREPSSCLLCEKYAKNICNIKYQNKLKTLPLSSELSKDVYNSWNRTGKAHFYTELYKI